MVAPGRSRRSYLIAGPQPWWRLSSDSWFEPRFNAWVSPFEQSAGDTVARVDMRVSSRRAASTGPDISNTDADWTGSGGPDRRNLYFTQAVSDSVDELAPEPIGFVSQFGNASLHLPITRNEGTTGKAGRSGWYVAFNQTRTDNNSPSWVAPKRLELLITNVPRASYVAFTSCWPRGAGDVLQTQPACAPRIPSSSSTLAAIMSQTYSASFRHPLYCAQVVPVVGMPECRPSSSGRQP
jgi:hypothetical protein